MSPRGPGLQLPGARQPKPGNQIRGAQLGGEAELGAGPGEPGLQPKAAPTFLPRPRPCSPDRAQPSPGVAATPTPEETHTLGRQLIFIGATFQSSGKLVWSSQLTFLPTCFGGMAWGEGQPYGRNPLCSPLQPMQSRKGREALRNCANPCLRI